jgi:hypothetical protein
VLILALWDCDSELESGTIVPYLALSLDLKASLISITPHPLNDAVQVECAKRYLSSKIKSPIINFKKSDIPLRVV